MSDDEEVRRRISVSVYSDTSNVIRTPLRVVACWRLGDGVFKFDHKLIPREAKDEFDGFWQIRERYPESPVALFGHADVTGNEDYNHHLAFERAQAAYGVINCDPDMWFELFANDPDGTARLQAELAHYGVDADEVGFGPSTFEAVKKHMEFLGEGRRLDPFDYLDDGLRAMQSCGEFNPVVRASSAMLRKISTKQRRKLDAVNRRVLAYFFEPGTHVGDWWPCPVAGAGPSKCRTRFWSDVRDRRSTPGHTKQFWPSKAKGKPPPEFEAADDLFCCRFYDRIARGQGCELVDPWRPPKPPPGPDPDPDPDPDPGPDPDPDPDPDPVPTPEPDPDDWELVVTCEHDRHINRRQIYAAGKDRIEVVPLKSGDLLSARTEPAVPVKWNFSGKTATVEHLLVANVPDPDPGPWEIANAVPAEYLIRASRGGRTRSCAVKAYPIAKFDYDFEKARSAIRKGVSIGLWLWKIVDDVIPVVEKLEVKFMEKDDVDGRFTLQWREHPGTGASKSSKRDYRSFLAAFFMIRGDPFGSFEGHLSISIVKVLKKLKKVKKLKKLGDLIDKIPKSVMKKLDSVSVQGGILFDLRGQMKYVRNHPDKTLPNFGHGPGKERLEVAGTVMWTVSGKIDLEELTGFDVPGDVKLELKLKCEAMPVLGLIFDFDKRVAGGYIRGRHEGLELAISLDLPGIDPVNFDGKVLDAGALPVESVKFEF